MPKQFIRLLGERTSFQDAVLRVSDRDLFAEPVIITNELQRDSVVDQLEAIGAKASILLEPVRRDSGPAVAAGASFIRNEDPDALVMALAADHVVRNVEAFKVAARTAIDLATTGAIVTFGIKPDRFATEYGYIRPGTALADGVFKVDSFVEKPDRLTAERYVNDGYFWNSGNFMFRADVLLSEYERFDPFTVASVNQAVERSVRDRGCVILDEERFGEAFAVSVDRAVMEKTDRITVVPVDMRWSDIGSWKAVWQLAEKDAAGNAAVGDAVFLNSTNSFVSSERLVCLSDVDNLAVVSTDDAVLVFDLSRGDSILPLVQKLENQERPQLDAHPKQLRSWGSSQSVVVASEFQVKRFVVKPGSRVSVQQHDKHAKHWIVIRGTALVSIGASQTILRENGSIPIHSGESPELENPGEITLELIEIQLSSDLG